TTWQGEFTDAYFAGPAPDPATFGLPTEDDGSRDDPLLSARSWAVSSFQPDADALRTAPTRIVIGVGEESAGMFTGRTSAAVADLLGLEPTVFPGDHGGVLGGECGRRGVPEEFAAALRAVLAWVRNRRGHDSSRPLVSLSRTPVASMRCAPAMSRASVWAAAAW